MPELYLTPSSISYLTLLILASTITTHLIVHSLQRRKRALLPQNGYLLAIFISITLLSFLLFLDSSLLPSDKVFPFDLANTVVAILIAALIQFGYHFPTSNSKQKVERQVVLIISCAYFLWELVFAIQQLLELQRGYVKYRSAPMEQAMIIGFAWVVIVFARNAVQNWKLPAVRNFTLIMLIPVGVAIISFNRIADLTATLLYPIVTSIGIIISIFFFALNYLASQPEQVSFVVKISGAVLTSMLVVFGTIPWLITAPYADHYESPVIALDHRTIHFTPDGKGGYVVDEIPFRWDADLGERIVFQNADDVIGYDFDFPFFEQRYHQIFISNDGEIGIGEKFYKLDNAYHFTRIPKIFPLFLGFHQHMSDFNNVFLRQETGKVVITWYKMVAIFPSPSQEDGTYTFQVILFGDGSFDFTYNGLPNLKFYADSLPSATAWAIGIKPVDDPLGTANFTSLPMQIGSQGALQDENRSFRIYIHQFLLPLAIAIVVSSLFVLFGATLLLNFGLARPLNALMKGIKNFDKGQRDIAIPIQSNDEIGFLTDSFNKLGGELNTLINNLEQRVADRTQELALVNEQLRSEMEARSVAQAQVMEQQRAVAALEERERLARELHDGIGQVLGFINVQAQSANDCVQAGDKESASQLLARTVEVAQEAHDDIRGYILGLKKEVSPPPQSFLSSLEQYCQHLSQNFGFQVRLKLPVEIPAVLATSMVENQLLLVIREALSNARAHSGQKEAEVMISFDETRLQAVVEDHGIGFRERQKSGHFGLGIMRERVEEVGGSLEIESTPGEGTRVTVSLPRLPGAESTSGLRILLVDDHPLFLEGMTNLMAGRGITIAGTARDGLEAQEKARELHPDAILMDIEMPHCDGLEATRLIKAEMPNIKIVMLTVSGEERHLFEALQSGASGYLLKSLNASELTILLEELLRGEVSLSPKLANKMLEAFTSHKSLPGQPPALHPEKFSAPAELTGRQMEILRLVAQGRTYKEIAAQLQLAEVTIKYHMGEILARLHLRSRREAIEYAQAGRLK